MPLQLNVIATKMPFCAKRKAAISRRDGGVSEPGGGWCNISKLSLSDPSVQLLLTHLWVHSLSCAQFKQFTLPPRPTPRYHTGLKQTAAVQTQCWSKQSVPLAPHKVAQLIPCLFQGTTSFTSSLRRCYFRSFFVLKKKTIPHFGHSVTFFNVKTILPIKITMLLKRRRRKFRLNPPSRPCLHSCFCFQRKNSTHMKH